MKRIFAFLLRAIDWLCLFTCVLSLLLLTASLCMRGEYAPIVRRINADGTAYMICRDANGLIFARQQSIPHISGPLVADMQTLDLIDVYDNGQRLPGMFTVWPMPHWVPQYNSEHPGWWRGENVLSGVGGFPNPIFHISMQRLALPNPTLVACALITMMPALLKRHVANGREKYNRASVATN